MDYLVGVSNAAGSADAEVMLYTILENNGVFLSIVKNVGVDPGMGLNDVEILDTFLWRDALPGKSTIEEYNNPLDRGVFTVVGGAAPIYVTISAIPQDLVANQTPIANYVSLSDTSGVHPSLQITHEIVVTPEPSATPIIIPSNTPTPIAEEGQIVTYPQPASNQVCFGYHAPAGNAGPVEILVYNLGFQIVAKITDSAVSGTFETACADITDLAPGVYFYKTKVGAYEFKTSRFGVVK